MFKDITRHQESNPRRYNHELSTLKTNPRAFNPCPILWSLEQLELLKKRLESSPITSWMTSICLWFISSDCFAKIEILASALCDRGPHSACHVPSLVFSFLNPRLNWFQRDGPQFPSGCLQTDRRPVRGTSSIWLGGSVWCLTKCKQPVYLHLQPQGPPSGHKEHMAHLNSGRYIKQEIRCSSLDRRK